MIAMQYGFTLPADYDMAIITTRIAQSGPRLNGFSGLLFKTFLYSSRKEGSPENRYAPFYLWRDVDSMRRFLQSSGFAALTRDFGWPQIRIWPVLYAPDTIAVTQAAYAVISEKEIVPFSDLNAIAPQAMLSAWDPSRWRLLAVNFTQKLPAASQEERVYRIGYVACGNI